jgi:hypothetical protein
MAHMTVQGGAKEATIRARIIRADGTVEDMGIVAYWNANPLKRLAFGIRQFIKKHTKRN